LIELTNVSKSYNRNKVKAVDNLTLTVKPGEIFGFLGPNGAGKTTTLKMIVGLLRPDAGRILVEGYDVTVDSLKAKQITTYVPDYPAIYERLTGLEYLNFIGDVYGVPKEARIERIQRWLDVFELAQVITNPIQSYSHGMKQKIVLTAALLPAPKIMVLDEPMVGLDPIAQRSLAGRLRALAGRGSAVLLTTHQLAQAEELATDAGLLFDGRLLARGAPGALRTASGATGALSEVFFTLAGDGGRPA